MRKFARNFSAYKNRLRSTVFFEKIGVSKRAQHRSAVSVNQRQQHSSPRLSSHLSSRRSSQRSSRHRHSRLSHSHRQRQQHRGRELQQHSRHLRLHKRFSGLKQNILFLLCKDLGLIHCTRGELYLCDGHGVRDIVRQNALVFVCVQEALVVGVA